MPVMAPIVLKDGQSTPVNHTYSPQGLAANLATFRDSLPLAFQDLSVLTNQTRPAAPSNGGHKSTWKFVLPHALSNDGACCVDTQNPPASTFEIGSLISKQATVAQKADLLAYLRSLVLTQEFEDNFLGSTFW